MAKKKAISITTIAIFAVAALGMILAIVGVCTDWVKYAAKTVIGNGESKFSLSDLAENADNLKKFGAMNAFAYITMILAILSTVATILGKFLKIKLLKPIAGLSGILTVLSAILLIVFTCVFCSENASITIGSLASGSFKWAAGAVLAVIGGFLSGLSAAASYKF